MLCNRLRLNGYGCCLPLWKTWIKVPETFRINVNGKLPKGVYSKDIILKLASIIKSDQAIYKALEFRGDTISSLSMDGRLTITSMGVDLGAKNAIMESDEHTREFLKKFGREQDYVEIRGDEEADYERVIDIDASQLEPLVSKPHYVENVDLAKTVGTIMSTWSFLAVARTAVWRICTLLLKFSRARRLLQAPVFS